MKRGRSTCRNGSSTSRGVLGRVGRIGSLHARQRSKGPPCASLFSGTRPSGVAKALTVGTAIPRNGT